MFVNKKHTGGDNPSHRNFNSCVLPDLVLEPEGHGRVAVGAKGHNERRLDLVFFLQRDLVITRVAI